jgi:phage-related protein (TIGR01555 family)
MARKKHRVNQRDSPKPAAAAPEQTVPLQIPAALALDAFSNPLARLGAGTPDASQFTLYTRQNFTMQYNTLTNLYRENWVVKRLIDVVPEDMTKSWYRIKSQLAPDHKQQITRLERTTRIRARILEGLKWGRLYGGAVAVIVIDGHDDILDQPLDYDTIMPGSFKGLIVVDRWSGVSPSLSIVKNVDDPEFGLPDYYTISTATFGFGIRVHHTRILRFTGRHLPYIEELAETYWGTSELEHVYSEIVKYDNTSYNIAALVFGANLKIYKMDGFEQLGTAPQNVIRDLYNTLTMMNHMMNSQGMQIMGKDDAFETQQFSFAGLSDIYELFMLDVSGASEIPVTRLFGRSPAGMNATGESDMQNYYDSIEEKQEAYLKPVIDRLLPILCMSEFFAIPDDLDFEFEPVRRPSEEEKKTIATQTTTAVSEMFNAGIISQKIALKELRESSRATGMWNNITDEDIERADSDFGIGGEPPDIMKFAGEPAAVEGVSEYEQSGGTPEQGSVDDKDTTAGVGVIVLNNTGENVLCGKRTDNGLICGAGGHVQEGETPAQAAIRETQEEFGVTPLNLKRIGQITNFEGGKYGEPYIYLCTEYEGELKASKEIRNPCFFPTDEFEPEEIKLFPPFAESLKLLGKE